MIVPELMTGFFRRGTTRFTIRGECLEMRFEASKDQRRPTRRSKGCVH